MDNNIITENMELKRLNRKLKIRKIMIIFLILMLILTFFSNTIMNYSIPKVSVIKMTSGIISRNVDASAIIESNQDYVVLADDSIEIKRTAVAKGQVIEEGQILFYLKTREESSDVKELRDMIDDAKIQYEKSLLELGNDYFDENQQIQKAREELNAAIAKRDNANNNSDTQSVNSTDSLSSLKKRLSLLNRDIEAINSENYDGLSSESKDKLQNELNSYISISNQYIQLSETLNGYEQSFGGVGSLTEYERNLAALKLDLDRLVEDKADKRKIEDAQIAYNYALSDYENLKELKNNIENVKSQIALTEEIKNEAWSDLKPKINNLIDSINLEAAEIEREILMAEGEDNSKTDYSSKENNNYDLEINNARYALDTAIHQLEIKIKSDNIQDKTKKLDLDAAKKRINEQEEKLAKLLEEKGSSEIISPVRGVVQDIFAVTGGRIEAGEQLVKINILADGFKATVTLNKDAAETIFKGQDATVTNPKDVKAVVTDIVKSKTSNSVDVTLELTGDVEAGQQIKIRFSESSEQSENVIPKKAVKEDSSGKFVYGVISRNTPIGNRYIVKKIPVQVIAEDDNQYSISGEFGDCKDYIIIASSKPFSSGDKVRLLGE